MLSETQHPLCGCIITQNSPPRFDSPGSHCIVRPKLRGAIYVYLLHAAPVENSTFRRLGGNERRDDLTRVAIQQVVIRHHQEHYILWFTYEVPILSEISFEEHIMGHIVNTDRVPIEAARYRTSQHWVVDHVSGTAGFRWWSFKDTREYPYISRLVEAHDSAKE